MSTPEKDEFKKKLLIECSKAILSNVNLETQYRDVNGEAHMNSCVAYVASTIVTDYVRRLMKEIELSKLL